MKDKVQSSITAVSVIITILAGVFVGIAVWANIPRGVHIRLDVDDD